MVLLNNFAFNKEWAIAYSFGDIQTRNFLFYKINQSLGSVPYSDPVQINFKNIVWQQGGSNTNKNPQNYQLRRIISDPALIFQTRYK